MGQSFLTHDEKSSGSPSPDLLQFSGATPQKSFGSLSSVKGTSTVSSSSQSPLESVDSEGSLIAASNTSPAPPAIATDDSGHADSYSSLVPTPILRGSVSRLREKFMNLDKKGKSSYGAERNVIFSNESNYTKEVLSGLDFIRPATTTSLAANRGYATQMSFSPTRSRSSVPALISPTSFRNSISSRSRTLPTTPISGYEKLDVIRSDNDLAECFRHMTLGSTSKRRNFSSPLVRYRPRTRPYVPPPRSVVIKESFLPVVQIVNMRPAKNSSCGGNSRMSANSPTRHIEDTPDRSNGTIESLTSGISCSNYLVPKDRLKVEDILVATAPSSSSRQKQRLDERASSRDVTNQEDHRVRKAETKDAEVNTSAEVLVLPKGTKTSVVLKSGDGKSTSSLKRRKRKGGIRRVTRVFGRIMIRLLEFF